MGLEFFQFLTGFPFTFRVIMTLYLNKRGQKIKKIILLHNFNQLKEIYEKIIILPKKEVSGVPDL